MGITLAGDRRPAVQAAGEAFRLPAKLSCTNLSLCSMSQCIPSATRVLASCWCLVLFSLWRAGLRWPGQAGCGGGSFVSRSPGVLQFYWSKCAGFDAFARRMRVMM